MIDVLDVLGVKPGHLNDVRRDVTAVYRPLVSEHGMQLANMWMSPAVELHDEPTELLVLWRLDRVAAFWRIRFDIDDARLVQFWRDIAPRLAHRTRRIMCDPDDEWVLR